MVLGSLLGRSLNLGLVETAVNEDQCPDVALAARNGQDEVVDVLERIKTHRFEGSLQVGIAFDVVLELAQGVLLHQRRIENLPDVDRHDNFSIARQEFVHFGSVQGVGEQQCKHGG